jgi:hypothetical protein
VIISNIFTELNEKFCDGLDNPPSFSLSISALPTVHGTRRTVFIGGSNFGKIAKAAVESRSAVVYLTASGWSPKQGNIKKITEVLKNLQLKPCVTIVIDAMANSAYLGTDENGLPLLPVKSAEDGRQHLIGDLQLAPPPPPPSCGDAAAAGLRTREAKVIDLCKLFGSAETPIEDLTTTDGTSI